MKVETLQRLAKPRLRKPNLKARRLNLSDLLMVTENPQDSDILGSVRADLLTQTEFRELIKKPPCRVVILCDPAPATLEMFSKLWPDNPPLSLLVSDYVDGPGAFLKFSRAEARKAPFATMLRGLVRDKEEKHAHELLARITHDMRSPMSVIKMACQFIKRKSVECEALKYVQMIEESSAGIQTLIGDILDYSKLNQGAVDFHLTKFNLSELLSSVLDATAILVKEKDVEVRADIHGELPKTVSGDPGRLRQILGNLLGNAVKFTEQGHVVLRARHADGVCYFDIEDTGIGIAEQSLKKIFQPYQQADSSILSRFGGTGLGLNICRSLIKQMGGAISVRSRLGEGSVFSFHIQLPEVEPQSSQLLSTTLWEQLQVWHLGDNCPKSWLERCQEKGVNVSVFQSAHELAERATLGNPDLLIFRLENGGFDELGRTLKYFTKKTPRVIVTTSCGQRGDGERCKSLGVGGYLTSPYELEDLKALVETVLHAEPGELITKHTLHERGITRK